MCVPIFLPIHLVDVEIFYKQHINVYQLVMVEELSRCLQSVSVIIQTSNCCKVSLAVEENMIHPLGKLVQNIL